MGKVILFGGSFDPPGLHHEQVCENLGRMFPEDSIFVVPCGYRKDKNNRNISLKHRIMLSVEAFWPLREKGIIQLDMYDLTTDCFTPTHKLDEKYSLVGEVWHFVGTDIISGGAIGQSEIQRVWIRGQQDFTELRFMVSGRIGTDWNLDDLPPKNQFVKMELPGSSTKIRELCARGDKSFEEMVSPPVASYIKKNGLYGWPKSKRQ